MELLGQHRKPMARVGMSSIRVNTTGVNTMSGAATDQTRDDAQARSRHCEYCSGSGQAVVYDRDFDGRRVVERDVIIRGEIKRSTYAMVVTAHCICAMGRWLRSKTDPDLLRRVPDMTYVLAGTTRWLAADPTGDRPYDPRVPGGGGVVKVKHGRPV